MFLCAIMASYCYAMAKPEDSRLKKRNFLHKSRGYANAIATIIYDVHLLVDYSMTNTSALPLIADIENDLIERGFKRLIRCGGNTKRFEEIEREFTSAVRLGRGRINSRGAAFP